MVELGVYISIKLDVNPKKKQKTGKNIFLGVLTYSLLLTLLTSAASKFATDPCYFGSAF